MKRLLLVALILLGAGCSQPAQLGTSESGSQWQVISQFTGYTTNVDPAKVPDSASPQGQNTTANEGDRISIRPAGYELFPTTADFSATSTPVESLHNFRTRSGENIMIRSVSTTLEYFETGNDTWETLKTGYTSADFGFADNNINTDQASYVYFGNGAQPFSRWNGAHTLTNGTVSSTLSYIVVDSTVGFDSSGSVVYCGQTVAYTSKTATQFNFAGAGSVECADNKGVAQAPREFAGATFPRGNIYLFADNRLFIAGVSSTSDVVYFSAYASSTDFGDLQTLVTSSTAATAGLFNLAEGGGAVTAMVMDEGSIYIFKRSIIYRATLTDSLYSITPLKTFDQKSQTTGAVNKRSTFTSGNGTAFITPDNQIMLLQRVETIDYPQITAISEPIKNTVDSMYFDDSSGITYKDKLYFSGKMSSDSTTNDTVLVYNLSTKQWDAPVVGWNVKDWTIYQDSNIEELYYGDSLTANTYKIITKAEDYIFDTVANWRSKRFDFGLPHGQKTIENIFVDGYISPSTNLRISLLCDEDGITQTYSTTLAGTETDYIYNSTSYNAIGLKAFGSERFGSSADVSGKKRFRVYLGKDFRIPTCYSAQLEFASDQANASWEVTSFGFLVNPTPVLEKRSLFHSFR